MLRQKSKPQASGARVSLIIEKELLSASVYIFLREVIAELASHRITARLYGRREGGVYVPDQCAAIHKHRKRAFGNARAAPAPSGMHKRCVAAS